MTNISPSSNFLEFKSIYFFNNCFTSTLKIKKRGSLKRKINKKITKLNSIKD
jgi:hypothetical protein